MTDHNAPKPPSASSMLKLLRAAGAGSRVELQPEHISALEAGIAALAFQHEVRQLVQHGPRPGSPQAHAARPSQDYSRESRDARSSPPQDSRPAREVRAPSRPPKPAQPPRPTEGSGAIWTPEEEARLRAQWERDDAIGAISESHKRSALACFARLIRMGAIPPSPDTDAATYLIKKQQPVRQSDASQWEARAVFFGFDRAAAAPARAKTPSP